MALKLNNKTSEEQAVIKSAAIAQIGSIPKTTKGVFEIEVAQINNIGKGVECFVKAWKDGVRVGFGQDGSVETERIRVFNPPHKVDDGTFKEVVDITGETILVPNRVENLQEALLQNLAHTIKIIGKGDSNIIEGSVGKTTSTFNPDANVESTSVDGLTEVTNADWTVARNAADGTIAGDTQTLSFGGSQNNSPGFELDRAFFLFDTSALPDTDTISSATLSIFDGSNGNTNTDSITYHIVSSTPASNTAIGTADHDQVGSISFGSKALSTFSNSTFADFTLNASGIAAITATGVSKFALRGSRDIDDVDPTGVNRFDVTYADSASNDPKLVVTHAASATSSPLSNLLTMDVG